MSCGFNAVISIGGGVGSYVPTQSDSVIIKGDLSVCLYSPTTNRYLQCPQIPRLFIKREDHDLFIYPPYIASRSSKCFAVMLGGCVHIDVGITPQVYFLYHMVLRY